MTSVNTISSECCNNSNFNQYVLRVLSFLQYTRNSLWRVIPVYLFVSRIHIFNFVRIFKLKTYDDFVFGHDCVRSVSRPKRK